MKNLRKALLLSALVFFSGCNVYRATAPVADYYYLNPNKSLSTIGRVAIVELDNESSFPAISTDVTESLFQELQKKQVFGLTIVRQDDRVWHSLQLDLDSTYTLEQLSAIRKALDCDAVLIGTITKYQPYPHLAIGLRLKLVDLTDGQLLWGLEQIWDASDKTTESQIRNYYKSHILPGSATLSEQLGTVSSLKFIKFVAYETAKTIKPKKEAHKHTKLILQRY